MPFVGEALVSGCLVLQLIKAFGRVWSSLLGDGAPGPA